MQGHRVHYEVEEIRGVCPLYEVGDGFVLDSEATTEVVNLDASHAVCLRALVNAWNDQMYQWGDEEVCGYLASGVGEVRIGCSMPGPPYTPCGYTIFRVTREALEESEHD